MGIYNIFSGDLKEYWLLESLNAEFNEVSQLSAETFKFNPNLKLLNLSSNSIKSIHADAFRGNEIRN